MSSNRSAGSGRSTSSLTLTSRWTSLDGGLLMRRIIALDLDQNRDYSLYYDPKLDYSLDFDPRSGAASASAEARVIGIYGGWACAFLSLGRPAGSAPPLFSSSTQTPSDPVTEGSCHAGRCECVSAVAVPRRASKSVGTRLKPPARHRLCRGHRTQS